MNDADWIRERAKKGVQYHHQRQVTEEAREITLRFGRLAAAELSVAVALFKDGESQYAWTRQHAKDISRAVLEQFAPGQWEAVAELEPGAIVSVAGRLAELPEAEFLEVMAPVVRRAEAGTLRALDTDLLSYLCWSSQLAAAVTVGQKLLAGLLRHRSPWLLQCACAKAAWGGSLVETIEEPGEEVAAALADGVTLTWLLGVWHDDAGSYEGVADLLPKWGLRAFLEEDGDAEIVVEALERVGRLEWFRDDDDLGTSLGSWGQRNQHGREAVFRWVWSHWYRGEEEHPLHPLKVAEALGLTNGGMGHRQADRQERGPARLEPVVWVDEELQGWHRPGCWEQFDRGVRSGNHLVILTGPPGTGKTWLPILYAALARRVKAIPPPERRTALLDHLDREGTLKLVRCRPNWTSPRPLVGGLAYDGETWCQGIVEDFIEQACRHRGQPHFLVFDEMNLSHPEHYLSDFISTMETGGILRDEGGRELHWPDGDNLVIVGTVNTDETTQTLSPRLKSRAWVVEVRTPWDQVVGNEEEGGDDRRCRIAKLLGKLDAALRPAGLGFGLRDLHHVADYARWAEDHDLDRVMWEALAQKLLPKLRGTRDRLLDPLGAVVDLVPARIEVRPWGDLQEHLQRLQERLDSEEYLAGC